MLFFGDILFIFEKQNLLALLSMITAMSMDFFNSMDPLPKTLWFMAIPFSILFLYQNICMFFGFSGTSRQGFDFGGSLDHFSGIRDYQFLTFRNLVNFLMSFSWAGISFFGHIQNLFVLILVSFLVGIAFTCLFILLIKLFQS